MGAQRHLAYIFQERMRTNCRNILSGPLETKVIDMEIGKASALKMCYAAYSKGTTALLCAVLGTAEFWGVRKELYQQWDMDERGFQNRSMESRPCDSKSLAL